MIDKNSKWIIFNKKYSTEKKFSMLNKIVSRYGKINKLKEVSSVKFLKECWWLSATQ